MWYWQPVLTSRSRRHVDTQARDLCALHDDVSARAKEVDAVLAEYRTQLVAQREALTEQEQSIQVGRRVCHMFPRMTMPVVAHASWVRITAPHRLETEARRAGGHGGGVDGPIWRQHAAGFVAGVFASSTGGPASRAEPESIVLDSKACIGAYSRGTCRPMPCHANTDPSARVWVCGALPVCAACVNGQLGRGAAALFLARTLRTYALRVGAHNHVGTPATYSKAAINIVRALTASRLAYVWSLVRRVVGEPEASSRGVALNECGQGEHRGPPDAAYIPEMV